jgi:hypothetical protein
MGLFAARARAIRPAVACVKLVNGTQQSSSVVELRLTGGGAGAAAVALHFEVFGLLFGWEMRLVCDSRLGFAVMLDIELI